jgi:ribosomal protein S18 acetylase RimI-like enzyme
MTIRPAQESDFARVTELLEELGRPRIPDAEYGDYRQAYLDQLEAPDVAHLVAVDDGFVVGFCSLVFRPRLNAVRPEAWIPDLIVESSARGRGAGGALLDEVESRARARGCFGIALESGHERREAHLLYRMVGMEDAGKSFRKWL